MKLLLVIASVALAGCSSFGPEKLAALDRAIREGRCGDAAAIANQTDDKVKFNNIGVVAENCERNQVKARGYYEYGARLGEQNAINNLLRLGVPVPIADIKAQNDAANAASAAAMSNALMMIQAAQPKLDPMPKSPNINCQSRSVGGTVYTNCN
jgi:hypothetical protein